MGPSSGTQLFHRCFLVNFSVGDYYQYLGLSLKRETKLFALILVEKERP